MKLRKIIGNCQQICWNILQNTCQQMYPTRTLRRRFYPIPSNITKVKEFDSYIKELLVENKKTLTLHMEKILKSSEDKVMDILGPLSKTENERDHIDIDDPIAKEQYDTITGLFEQTVLLVTQASCKIRYQRRYNVLSTRLTSSSRHNKAVR